MTCQQSTAPCPCGSGKPYSSCCQRYHQDHAIPASPEALMRSRYTAFALKLADYLITSWHPSSCPADLDLDNSPTWLQLQVLSSSQHGDEGKVHFRALHTEGKGIGFLEEHSTFVREGQRWYYLSGETTQGRLT
ncbi:Zn-binding protein [Aliidiomarina minuta]|uniref:UPF0225 protein CWE09_04795 n=1 Tax=Aliidiomarina minuta TaxID=880057 RepID=A0A432W7J7_9GAMM|nr:YchJ family metal-binding protein [Aliidiomarina minuta]RUO26048.1 Zn-binding protein [Aliidiomarina minuta]